MTGKDLVRRPAATMAPLRTIVVDEVPLWDAKVKNIIVELSGWMRNHEAFPQKRRDAIRIREGLLYELVDVLEAGLWEEGVLTEPERIPEPQVETRELARVVGPNQVKVSLLELLDDEAAFNAYFDDLAQQYKDDLRAKFHIGDQ